MIHGEFVYPSYALTVGGIVVVVVWSWIAMRRAESAAAAIRGKSRR